MKNRVGLLPSAAPDEGCEPQKACFFPLGFRVEINWGLQEPTEDFFFGDQQETWEGQMHSFYQH